MKWNIARVISVSAATYALVGGIVSFLGWALQIEVFTDWWNTGIVIKANTAVAIVACAMALLLIANFPARRSIQLLGAFVAAIGALTLIEHLTGWNFGIDTLIFDEAPGATATAAPGRMGPPASTSFIALGFALVLLVHDKRHHRLCVGLALGVLCVCTLSIIGYWYGAQEMYTIPRLTGIALQSATMFVALSIGVMASVPDSQPIKMLLERSDAGMLARRVVPVVIIIPIVLGWLRVKGANAGLYDQQFGTALRTLAEIAVLGGMLWWSLRTFGARDLLRRRAEEERQHTERRMRHVLEASAVPFIILTPVRDGAGAIYDFRWSYMNAAAAQSIGRGVHELVGKCVTEVFPRVWEQHNSFDHYIAVASGGEVREFEVHSTATAKDNWQRVIASPLDGEVAVWFADISQGKRQEFELREADRRKDEFLATLAHELRNPLAPIRQAALLAGKATVTDAQRKWCNDVIERQVQHMSLLLDDLLDVSRITRGMLQLRKQPVDLSSLIAAAVETARPLIDARKHSLRIDMPPRSARLDVDSVRLSQVISNLLNNAAKYTNVGGSILLSAFVDGADIEFSVQDNGIGIEKSELGSLFRMFAQTKSAQERSEGGLGIGLALTKGLVELHGGTIKAESAGPGTGSKFTLRIPNAVLLQDSSSRPAVHVPRPVLCRRILLADDNQDAAQSLAMLLELDGHEVRIAHDGEEAMREFSAFAPDVTLLDIGMPTFNGYEVAKRIRAANEHTLLIAITGWGQGGDREKSAAVGFDHHLTKPVDYDALAKLLEPNAARNSIRSRREGSHG